LLDSSAIGLLHDRAERPLSLVPQAVREAERRRGCRGTQECKNSRMGQEEEAELSRWWQFRSGKSTINF
jgi:hypothetical protein